MVYNRRMGKEDIDLRVGGMNLTLMGADSSAFKGAVRYSELKSLANKDAMGKDGVSLTLVKTDGTKLAFGTEPQGSSWSVSCAHIKCR